MHRRLQWVMVATNAVLLVTWTVLLYPTITWWRESVPWLAFMSIAALLVSSFTGLTTAVTVLIQTKEASDSG